MLITLEQCVAKTQVGLANADFFDATLLVNYVRIVKSDKEIPLMCKAGVMCSMQYAKR